MRKTVKIAMTVFGMMSCFALLTAQQPSRTEEYLPILVDGRVWVYGDSLAGPPDIPIRKWVYKEIEKDTMLDQRMCKKMIAWHSIDSQDRYCPGCYYEEDGKVYRSDLDESGKHYFAPGKVHIDMNLKVGDDFGLGKVITVDSINVRGVVRKRIIMNSCIPIEEYAFFVEGIGASSYSYVDPGPGDVTETGTERYLLYVIDENGEVIFTQADFRAPSYSQSGIGEIERDTEKNGRIYDLFGRLVANPLPGTVYIRDGKKFVQPRR